MDLQHILNFLVALQRNNNKAWMEENQVDYQKARNTFIDITDFLIKGMASLDKHVADLEPKRCIFRINRDIRFSKDKSPYKANMGAYLAKGGRNNGYAGYYLHLAPNDQSFIAGGIYQPTADVLKKIRQEIDYNGDDLDAAVNTAHFKKLFGSLQGEKLKRPPKGYDIDHPQIEWLKMKSFLATCSVKDSVVVKKDFLPQVLTTFQALVPLNQFLNTAIDA
ncbi:MAG: DUF2461 domain-containing protein [Bacteroidota bacterium]